MVVVGIEDDDHTAETDGRQQTADTDSRQQTADSRQSSVSVSVVERWPQW